MSAITNKIWEILDSLLPGWLVTKGTAKMQDTDVTYKLVEQYRENAMALVQARIQVIVATIVIISGLLRLLDPVLCIPVALAILTRLQSTSTVMQVQASGHFFIVFISSLFWFEEVRGEVSDLARLLWVTWFPIVALILSLSTMGGAFWTTSHSLNYYILEHIGYVDSVPSYFPIMTLVSFMCSYAIWNISQSQLHGLHVFSNAYESINAREVHKNILKTKWISDLSHELRTPLAAIIGGLGLFLEEETIPSRKDLIELCATSGRFMLALINEVLDISRLEKGLLTLELSEFNLPKLLAESCSVLAVQAQASLLDFVLDIDTNVPVYYRGDPTRIQQILYNLIGNSLKFCRKGDIIITCWAPNPEKLTTGEYGKQYMSICIAVSDSGIGISSERQDSIFEEFETMDAPWQKGFRGIGLGLPISKRIAQMMEGGITVESFVSGEPAWKNVPRRANLKDCKTCFYFEFLLEPVATLSIVDQTIRQDAGILELYHRAPLEFDLSNHSVGILEPQTGSREVLGGICSTLGMNVTYYESMESVEWDGKDIVFVASTEINLQESSDIFDRADRVIVLTTILSPEAKEFDSAELHFIRKPFYQDSVIRAILKLLRGNHKNMPISPGMDMSKEISVPRVERSDKRVLLVDDSAITLAIQKRKFERESNNVTAIFGGKDSIAKIKEREFDVAFIDQNMPGYSGFETASLIRELEKDLDRKKRMPIYILTADASLLEDRDLQGSGVKEVILKPIANSQIREILKKL